MHRSKPRRRFAIMLMLTMTTLGAGALSAGPATACEPIQNCIPDVPTTSVWDKAIEVKIHIGALIDINRKLHTSSITYMGTVVRTTNVDGIEHTFFTQTMPNMTSGAGEQPSQAAGQTVPPGCTQSYYGSGFKAYKNYYSWVDASIGFVEYRVAPFTEDNARYLYGEGYTWQVELCQIGGGTSANRWRANNIGQYTTLQETDPHIIGTAVYSGATKNPDARSLAFKLEGKGASISGSINIAANHRQSGGQGGQSRAGEFNEYKTNGMWQMWDGHDSPANSYQGSDDYEGNVSHGLWEFPMSDVGTVAQTAVWIAVNCPGNRGCH